MPRYLQLGALFRRQVTSGRWPNGDQIPTIDDLSGEYGVARATIRHALGILESEGLIERYRAKGTFVTYKPQEMIWCDVQTDWSGLLKSLDDASIEVLSEESGQQPPSLCHVTGERARSYRRYKRRHSRRGEPFLLADLYLDEAIAKAVTHEELVGKTALSILAGVGGLKLGEVRQTLTIGAADVITAEGLNIPLNAPVAHVQRSADDASGRLIMVTDGVYRGDLVRLDLKLK